MPSIVRDRHWDNDLNLNRYLGDEYFTERWGPAFFEITQGVAGTTWANASNALIVVLQDGSTREICTTRPKRTYWINGYLTLKVFYSSTNNTGNFEVNIVLGTKSIGGLSTTTNNLISTGNLALAEPGTIATIAELELTSPPNAILSTDDLLHLQIRRNGSSINDTATGDLRIWGVTIQYHPVNRQ